MKFKYTPTYISRFQNFLYSLVANTRAPLNFLILTQKKKKEKKYSDNNPPIKNPLLKFNEFFQDVGEHSISLPNPSSAIPLARTHVKGPRDRAEIINVARSKNHTPYPSTRRVEGSGGTLNYVEFSICAIISVPTNTQRNEDESTIPIIDKTISPSPSPSPPTQAENRFVSVDRGGRACTAPAVNSLTPMADDEVIQR